jgi:hypothetical protein
MTYNEKKSLTNILSSLLITVIYGIIMYQKYLSGILDDTNIFRFWAIIILIFIPISIVARIIIMIVFHIFEAAVQTAKGNDIEDEMDIVDERDKLIQVKATAFSMYIFSLGFVLALMTQLFKVSNHVFFIVLVVAGLLTDIVSEFLMIRYYRKGV